MNSRLGWLALAGALLVLACGAGVFLLLRREVPAGVGARPARPEFPGGHPIDAGQIATGRIAMERLPEALGSALEQQSAEIVKNAQALESKQARITGVCAPGSAIRIIGEDGSVRCQALPRGVVSVASLAAVARLSTTATAQGAVPGGVGRYQVAGEDDYLVVPVPAPDGAVITGFTYVFYDAHPEIDGVAYLYRSDDVSMAAASTAGSAPEVRSATTHEIVEPRIDAARYAYFVYFRTSAEAGANLVPISASITYRLP